MLDPGLIHGWHLPAEILLRRTCFILFWVQHCVCILALGIPVTFAAHTFTSLALLPSGFMLVEGFPKYFPVWNLLDWFISRKLLCFTVFTWSVLTSFWSPIAIAVASILATLCMANSCSILFLFRWNLHFSSTTSPPADCVTNEYAWISLVYLTWALLAAQNCQLHLFFTLSYIIIQQWNFSNILLTSEGLKDTLTSGCLLQRILMAMNCLSLDK